MISPRWRRSVFFKAGIITNSQIIASSVKTHFFLIAEFFIRRFIDGIWMESRHSRTSLELNVWDCLCPCTPSHTTRFFCLVQRKLMSWRSGDQYCIIFVFSPISGPPKHKPPPPVKAGSSTEMVSGQHGVKSIFIVVTAIIFYTHAQYTHTQSPFGQS